MALPVVTSYQFIAQSGGKEVFEWIRQRSEEGFELKACIQNVNNSGLDFIALMQRPMYVVDGTEGWNFPDQ